MSDLNRESLEYHQSLPKGKIAIASVKPCETQHDLSLAYTPGVAAPCREIAASGEAVWEYTGRGNRVAIVTDGTAVLGLGKIGPEAGLPVMEGKAVLFKKFADIDAIPLCMKFDGENYLEDFICAVKALEPSFGGINIEDVAAPACFELARRLKAEMGIPVFHDDQDGTAVILAAGLINALKVVGKPIENVKIVFNGAGAAGIACATLIARLGAAKENIFMCDSKGLIIMAREDLNEQKRHFACDLPAQGLAEIISGADVFIGVSVAGALSQEMVRSMAKDAIVFAVANPTPEIMPDEALTAGVRIVATGRSDFPNQLNNSLGFPGIFRGALDARASDINQEMQLAAAQALATLVEEPIPSEVQKILEKAYPEEAAAGVFAKENPLFEGYIIPKQFDPRVVPRVSEAVAKAAKTSGVARV